jgi:glutaredoxin 3
MASKRRDRSAEDANPRNTLSQELVYKGTIAEAHVLKAIAAMAMVPDQRGEAMVKHGIFALAMAAGAVMATGLLAPRDAAALPVVGATAHAVDVIMYATKDCPYCAQTREYLTSHGVQWEERDIETSPQAAAEWKAKGGVGTPLVLINGEQIQGFDKAKLEEALKKDQK